MSVNGTNGTNGVNGVKPQGTFLFTVRISPLHAPARVTSLPRF